MLLFILLKASFTVLTCAALETLQRVLEGQHLWNAAIAAELKQVSRAEQPDSTSLQHMGQTALQACCGNHVCGLLRIQRDDKTAMRVSGELLVMSDNRRQTDPLTCS